MEKEKDKIVKESVEKEQCVCSPVTTGDALKDCTVQSPSENSAEFGVASDFVDCCNNAPEDEANNVESCQSDVESGANKGQKSENFVESTEIGNENADSKPEKCRILGNRSSHGLSKKSKSEKDELQISKDLMAQKSMAKNIGMNTLSKLKESLFSVLPVAVIVLIFALTPVTDFTSKEIVTFVVSAIMLILGIALFNVGADLAMTPMGEHVGAGLTKSKKLPLLLGVGFAMGVLITVAEPDLSVLAQQVKAAMDSTVLIATVGVGVGVFLVIAISKIVFRKDLSSLLMFFYMVLFALTAIIYEQGKGVFLPMAFDSGGVTTGPITVPFIMALGVGVALNTGGRNAKENSFGLIALCSIGPMLAVMALSLVAKGDMSFTLPDYSIEANLGANFAPALGAVALEVLIALGLIVVFFAILQVTVLKLPKQKSFKSASESSIRTSDSWCSSPPSRSDLCLSDSNSARKSHSSRSLCS